MNKMKNRKAGILCAMALCLMLILPASTACAEDIFMSGACGPSLYWKLSNLNGLQTLTIYGSGPMTSGISTAVGDGESLVVEKLVIENGVTSLCDCAIPNGEFTSISIPNSVEALGNYVFSRCDGLRSISIGSGLASITPDSFSNLDSLQSISVVSSNAYFKSSGGVLFSKDGTKLYKWPQGLASSNYLYTVPSGVTEICDHSFSYIGGSSLKTISITIPDSVTTVAANAFDGYTLVFDTLNLGKGINQVGAGAFSCFNTINYAGSQRQFSAIPGISQAIGNAAVHYGITDVASGTCGNGVTWVLDSTDLLTVCGQGDMTDYASADSRPAEWENAASLLIENGVSSVGSHAFDGCESLTAVDLGSVSSIGESSFRGCTGISSLTIPASAVSVGDFAFSGCANLAVLNIGKNIAAWNASAFNGCGISTINVYGSGSAAYTLINGVLFSADEQTLLLYPKASGAAYTIPENVTAIGAYAFSGSYLQRVTIPASVTEIGSCAFADCSRLSQVVYGDTLGAWTNSVSIGDGNAPLLSAAFTCEPDPLAILDMSDSHVVAAGGKYASVFVTAQGAGLTYKWYIRNAGADDFVFCGQTGTRYSAAMNPDTNNRQVYCVVSDASGASVQSTVWTLRGSPVITGQPVSTTVPVGSAYSVQVQAEGIHPLTYQWYVKNPEETEYTLTEQTSAVYSGVMTAEINGSEVYCVVSDETEGISQTSGIVQVRASAPVITVEPSNVLDATVSGTATFTLIAHNAAGYQWQYATYPSDGVSWVWRNTEAAGAETDTLTVDTTEANAKLYFRCVITGTSGKVISSQTVHFVYAHGAYILIQPSDVTGAVSGGQAVFSLQADFAQSYQWQWASVPSDGKTWKWSSTGATGAKTDTLTVNATTTNSKLYFRCAVTGLDGKVVYSEKAHFVFAPGASITAQPSDALNVASGGQASFTVQAENAQSYQWQWASVPSDGQTWKWSSTGATGAKTDTLTVNATASNSKLYFRCAITGLDGKTVYSEKAHFVFAPGASITVQPSDALNVASGGQALFTVQAENAQSYQWQWASVPSEGQAWTWKATGATGAKTDTLTVNATATNAKLYFRCAVTGLDGKAVYSEKAHFVLGAGASITVQPSDALNVVSGGQAVFTVQAENAQSYQWQWASVPSEGQAWTWKSTGATGAKTDTLTINATATNAKLYFRCAITGLDGKVVYSEKAHFVFAPAASITGQPSNALNVASGSQVSFTVSADNVKSYQWQYATAPSDGQTWKWKSTGATGAKTDTLTISATATNAKLYFRCAVTGLDEKVIYSEKAHFTFPPAAVIVSQPVNAENVTASTAVFHVTAENVQSYQWQWASVPSDGTTWKWKSTGATGAKTDTLTINATSANAKLYFRCAITGLDGKVIYTEKVHFVLAPQGQ